MVGRLVLRGVLVLCLVQAVRTGGNVPQSGGRVASFLIPSKGYVSQAAAFVEQATQGNGAAAPSQSGFGSKGNGFGVISGPTTGQQIKGYEAPVGRYLGQGTKGNGYGAPAAAYGGQGDKGNGYGAQAGGYGGQGTKGNGLRGHGGNRMKGYGRPPYSPALGMGQFRGPQPARNQVKGFTGGDGGAGLSLGPRYGHGAKGPMKGRGGVRSPNGNGAMPNGFSNILNGHGAIPNEYSNGATPNGYGSNPKGYGAAAGAVKGFGPQMNGRGVGGAAALGGYEHQPEGYGLVNGKGHAVRGAALSSGKTLKGGVLSPQQQAATAVDGASSPTSGVHYLGSNEKYQQLPSPVSQDKMYKQTQLNLESNPESAPAIPVARYLGPQRGPKPAPMGLQEKGQTGTKYEAAPEPGAARSPGFMTGVPEQNSAESDVVFGVGGTTDPESTRSIKTKAVAGSDTAESTENIPPEETLSMAAAKETGIKSWPETGRGTLPSGETESGRGQGAKPAKPGEHMSIFPQKSQFYNIQLCRMNRLVDVGIFCFGFADCGPTRQWMKRLRSGYSAGGLNFPGLNNGHGAGLGYPYGGRIAQPGYGQGVYPAAGHGNGNLYGDHVNSYGEVGQPDYLTLGQVLPSAEQSGGTTEVSFSEVPAGIDGTSQLETEPADLIPNRASPGGQTLGLAAEKSNPKYGVGGLQFGEPVNLGINGAGNYGYGVNPYVPAGDAKATGKYGYGGILNGGQLLGLGNNGNIPGRHGYGTLPYEAQPAGFTPEAKSAGQYGLTGSPYHPAPSGLGYDGKSVANYENVGYTKGQVNPDAVAFPVAPTPSPSLEDSPDLAGSFTPDEDVQDLPDADGTAGFLESAPAAATRAKAHLSEHPDDLQLPRQIQIQQHLKLHFHPQEGRKYNLNGFFGNSDHQD
ncbi:calymmin [Anableps anableps]